MCTLDCVKPGRYLGAVDSLNYLTAIEQISQRFPDVQKGDYIAVRDARDEKQKERGEPEIVLHYAPNVVDGKLVSYDLICAVPPLLDADNFTAYNDGSPLEDVVLQQRTVKKAEAKIRWLKRQAYYRQKKRNLVATAGARNRKSLRKR